MQDIVLTIRDAHTHTRTDGRTPARTDEQDKTIMSPVTLLLGGGITKFSIAVPQYKTLPTCNSIDLINQPAFTYSMLYYQSSVPQLVY